MKAIRIHAFGAIDKLALEELPKPVPAPGELLIQVRAASVNPVDYKIREGRYPGVRLEQLPITLGRDVAGVVTELGEGVQDFAVGDEVFALLPEGRGGYAEWVAAPAAAFAPKPRSLDFIQAAATPLAALTAWQGLYTHGGLKVFDRVLIHGASGGVGPFAVQFAVWEGADVFATASAEHRAFVEDLGPHRVIDYKAERFEDAVSDIDLVYDLIGGETEARSWSVLRAGGRLVSTVHEPDPDKAAEARATCCRYTCQPSGRQLRQIAGLIDAGRVKVAVAKVYTLEQGREAQRSLESGSVAGKIVLSTAA